MSERQKQHQGRSSGDDREIRGRDFAGENIAANEGGQTRSHAGLDANVDESGESVTPSEGGEDPGRSGETSKRGDL